MPYKVKNIESQNLLLANLEIFSNRKLSVKIIYWLSRLGRELQQNFKILQEERTKLLEDNCLKGEDGKPIITDSQYAYADESIKTKAIESIGELMQLESEMSIDKLKIEIDKLQDAISANEMVLLEPFVDFVDAKGCI